MKTIFSENLIFGKKPQNSFKIGFCIDIIMKESQHQRSFLVGCSQLLHSSNEIARVFDHQYIWKKSNNLFDFLDGDSYQAKVASETITFGYMWLILLLCQSDCRIQEGINQHLRYFACKQSSKKASILRLLLLVGCGQLCLRLQDCRIQIAGFFDHQYI